MKIAPTTTFYPLLAALTLSSCSTSQESPQPQLYQPPQPPSKSADVTEKSKQPSNRPLDELNEDKAAMIGKKIWMNEGAAQAENLTVWKKGDTFASLGIGSFKWYPAGIENSENEFSQLLAFLQLQKADVTVPEWLQNQPLCPWKSREEFYNNRESAKMLDLRKLLGDNIPQQVRFIIKRLEQELPAMLAVLPTEEKREYVRQQFYRVAQKPVGIYALIDYINFQGKGMSPNEPYQDDGWGLLQVLERMPGSSSNVMGEFAHTANKLIMRHVQQTPEDKYLLPGWQHRLKTYTYEF
ncbi:MAG: hypothetical protein DRR19_20010 [Candidatus Parabeggiatoa sp. nov. 1]|nr:MAG: hypothetical protein DRR19_20010 [Gammaproteobacteria bacterium]